MSYARCSESAKFLLSRTKYRPSVAIICGTGLGTLGDLLSDTEVVSYVDIPHFPLSTGDNHRKYICCCFVRKPVNNGFPSFVVRVQLYTGPRVWSTFGSYFLGCVIPHPGSLWPRGRVNAT